MPITSEALQEALAENPELLIEALEGIGAFVDERVRGVLAEERTITDAERDAVIDRQWELRDLRDSAHKLIGESKLPDTWQEGLCSRFDLREDRTPTPELDLVDDIDENGAVTKTAADKLRESVEQEIKQERRRLAEVAPTRVRGQGPATLKEGEETDEPEVHGEPGFHRTLLQEAGVDPDKAWAGL